MAWSVKSAYRLRAVSTFGLNSGGVAVIISQGAKFLRSHTGNVCAVVVIAFTAAPNGMIGLLHPGWERSDEVRRLIEVPGTVTSGSLNIRAVAGMVLGTTNPELAPSVELNTDMTTAPGNPAAKRDNSVATAAFYNVVDKIKYSATQLNGDYVCFCKLGFSILTANAAPGNIPPPVTPVPLPPADPPDPPPPPPPAGGAPWGTKVGNGGGTAASKAIAPAAAAAAAPGLPRSSRTGKNNSFRVKFYTEI